MAPVGSFLSPGTISTGREMSKDNVFSLADFRKREEGEQPEILSEAETEVIIQNLFVGMGTNTTEEMAIEVVAWAAEARIRNAMLELVLIGEVFMSFDEEGEIVFTAKE